MKNNPKYTRPLIGSLLAAILLTPLAPASAGSRYAQVDTGPQYDPNAMMPAPSAEAAPTGDDIYQPEYSREAPGTGDDGTGQPINKGMAPGSYDKGGTGDDPPPPAR